MAAHTILPSRMSGAVHDGYGAHRGGSVSTNVKPKIISLDVTPTKPSTAPNEVVVRGLLDDLLRSGHAVVETPERASMLWLAATRAHPGADVRLTRTPGGYRVEILSKHVAY